MSQNVAEFVWKRLSEWGLSRAYGYPGDGVGGLDVALEKAKDFMHYVQVRHEEMAAFMACAIVVRRSAFLAAGGYHKRYHLGAEESLLALELLEANWELVYDPELVLVHAPTSAGRNPRRRRVFVMRNRLWTAWLRHSAAGARAATASLAWEATRNPEALAALLRAVAGLPWIMRERRPVQPEVERVVGTLTELPP